MLKMEVIDSDDELDNFQSEIWGDGTSKIVAGHYKSLHNRNAEKAKNGGKNEALTVNHFLDIGNQLANTRKLKQQAKEEGIKGAQRRAELELLNKREQIEIERLRAMLK